MPDTVEAIYRILSTRALSGGEQRLPSPPGRPSRLDQLSVGQHVQGKVLGIANGRATVLIGNQPVHMDLPVKAAVGDTFQLVFAGQHPRPTFVLTEPGQAASAANPADDIAHVPGRVLSTNANGEAVVLIGDRTVRMELPASVAAGDTFRLVFASQPPPPSLIKNDQAANVSTHFSDAAQVLGAAMKMVLDRKAPASVSSQTPSLDAWPRNPAALAIGLRLALARTGLFYESHLFEWSNGDYPLSSLLQEPQGRFSDPATVQKNAPPGMEMADPAADADLLHVIAQQLQLLENHSLVWRGEAWPGQAMEWEVTRHREEDGQPQDSSAPSAMWSTRITIEMPRLGKVIVDIHLDTQGRLDVRLAAGGDTVASLMEPGRADMVRRLVEAGCQVNNLTVTNNAPA